MAAAHPERDLYSRSRSVPADFLQSLFVLELLQPSERLWISSPWISDVEIIDNSGREFVAICPDWGATKIRLSQLIEQSVYRGTSVTIIHNGAPSNRNFLARIADINPSRSAGLRVVKERLLHDKGVVSDHFVLSGSMNMTVRGVYVNEESLVYRTDPAVVAERQLSLQNRWGTGE